MPWEAPIETTPDRVRDALDRDGYCVVRGLVGPTEVRRIADAFDALLARARALDRTSTIDGALVVIDTDPFRLHRVVWAGALSAVLARYGDDPRFLTLARAALGDGPVVQLIQQAHMKLPGDGVDFPWHQDASNRRYGTDLWSDVDGRGSFVQIVLAVDAADRANGGLGVIPGSHRKGFVADVATGVLPPGTFDEGEAVFPDLAPGDALVFGPFLIHGSAANASARARRVFIQGYAQPGANRRVYPGCGTGVLRG